MKVFNAEGKHIKTVPGKFEVLDNLEKHITNFNSKRLDLSERFDMELDYFHKTLLDRHIKNLIKDLEFKKCMAVAPREGDVYFVAVFGDYDVKCARSLYECASVKGSKFVNN